jgi:acetyltransferase-like isoleucine patch superfamily enzyme
VNRTRHFLDTVIDDLRAALFHSFVNVIVGSSWVPRHVRRGIYRLLGFKIGRSSLSPHLEFKTNNIDIGDDVYINERCFFDNIERVTLGDAVYVGPDVMFGTTSHAIGDSRCRAGRGTVAPVSIGSGSWIGGRAILLPGVTVGEGCVVAAGAIVTKDCLPNGIYAGVPARRIRDLPT